MTWTSDRSGMASSGVSRRAISPQAVRMTVASSTRKRLCTDQRMTLSMDRYSGAAGPGRCSVAVMGRPGRAGVIGHAHEAGLEAGFGVDEELAGHHDFVPCLEA